MHTIYEMCDEKTTNEQMRDTYYYGRQHKSVCKKIMVRARIDLYYFRGCEWHFCTFLVRRRRGVCVCVCVPVVGLAFSWLHVYIYIYIVVIELECVIGGGAAECALYVVRSSGTGATVLRSPGTGTGVTDITCL